MPNANWLWWIPALPLLGSAIAGILHFLTLRTRNAASDDAQGGATAAGTFTSSLGASVAIAAMSGAFGLAIKAFFQLRGESLDALESSTWEWIHATGDLSIGVAMVVDHLSSIMTLVITGVGLLIHVYAAGYMKGDPGYAKFFSYLNLFVAMMLMLVLSSSLLGLFVGWEGVGLCSYLLIGFWYTEGEEKGWPAKSAQKAFVVNRIGDACFLIGSFLLIQLFGTLDLSDIGAAVAGLTEDPTKGTQLALAALLLFGGACGKSAQLPLFTWLPDAMAGPTPVSALIHAATMVTAGVYLIVRLNPLFAASPSVMFLIAAVGALTAFIAGSTALVQRDLKKVLAYSTVSQLGFMFLALGSGAFVAAIFHLVTHAFFKALLFLGAGSVIHGMHDEQDMHRMGRLRKYMPVTFITFCCGSAALAGMPLLSGYFSKDEILAHTFTAGGPYYALWAIGLVTAAMTAFYTFRMVALTFFGDERFDQHVKPHESPISMTGPLMVLAVLSVFGGLLGLPVVMSSVHHLSDWLAPVIAPGVAIMNGEHGMGVHHLSHNAEIALLFLGAVIAMIAAHKGFYAHKNGTGADEQFAMKNGRAHAFLSDAWGIDRAYRRGIVQPVKMLSFLIAVVVDQFAIDGAVNGIASGTRNLGTRLRRMADGSIASYGLWMGGTAAGIALLWMVMGA